MNDDPYKNIPSLDIEIDYREETSPKRASIPLFIFSLIFISLSFFLNLLLGVPDAPEYMSSNAKVSYLKGRLYGPVYLPLIILLFSQLFRVFRNNRARIKVLFWISLFFLVGMAGRLLNA